VIFRAIAFSLLAALVGESIEIFRLEAIGVSSVAWQTRLVLFCAYALVGLVLAACSVLARRWLKASWTIALGLLIAILILPWLNFDYLPGLWSARSLSGNALAVAVVVAATVVATRFSLVALAVTVAFATFANARGIEQRAATPEPNVTGVARGAPNVLVLLIDTLRADHLGTYGYERATSQTFDQLARTGVVFERAVTQAPWTKPAVASLFTSAYLRGHGVVWKPDALGEEPPTLAEVLREAGYRTAAFSSNPWISPTFRFDQGFDEFHQSAVSSGIQFSNLFRLLSRSERVASRLGVPWDLSGLLRRWDEENQSNSARDEALVAAFLGWLGERSRSPFFVYVHLMGPHAPYDPPARFTRPFRDPQWNGRPIAKLPPPPARSIFTKAVEVDSATREMLIAQYDGAVAFTDSLLARIVAGLGQTDLLDRTLLIITSDHGEEFYEHGNWGHGRQLYDELVRVPLLFRLPGGLEPGRRQDFAMLVDILPTIAGLLDLEVQSPAWVGRDLFAEARGERDAVFAECYRFEGARYESRMTIADRRKLIETQDEAIGEQQLELYDLTSDPGEQNNLLSGRPGTFDGAGELLTLMHRFKTEGPKRSAPEVEVDRATRERLRALGY
jgi:arylsulfatase A-like enzyme